MDSLVAADLTFSLGAWNDELETTPLKKKFLLVFKTLQEDACQS